MAVQDFELKNVQTLTRRGSPCKETLHRRQDECYNVEWSTELSQEAFEEYVKAWFAIKLISKEYGLGDPDGYMFNMSVGYDLKDKV